MEYLVENKAEVKQAFVNACINLLGVIRNKELRIWKVKSDLRELIVRADSTDCSPESLDQCLCGARSLAELLRRDLNDVMSVQEEFERQLSGMKEPR